MSHGYRFLEHTADVAVEATADSREGLVLAGIEALAELIGLDGAAAGDDADSFHEPLLLDSGDDVDTMVDALNEWLYYVQDRGLRPLNHKASWRGAHLRVDVEWAEPHPPAPLESEVKAVTFHGAELEKTGDSPESWRSFWIADM